MHIKLSNPFRIIRTKAATPLNVYMVNDKSFSSIFRSTTTGNAGLIENFETIPDLFIITNFLAKRVAKIPVKVVKPSGRDAPNSELWKLINQPNYYQSWQELMRNDYAYYKILGNAYLYGIKSVGFGDQVTSLFNLPADKTGVILARSKDLPAWLNEVAGYKVDVGGKDYTLTTDEVLHNRNISLRYDSGAWVYGISQYIPGDKINNELKAIYDAKTSIIEHRGALGIVSNESENPDTEESQRVKADIKEKFGLGSHQDKFIVTTQKLTWQQMSLGIQELQLIENAKYSFDKLCQLSEFDPVIFSTDGSTFANKEQATKDLYKNVIKPEVDERYEVLSEWISPGYGGDKIVPDWDKVQELEIDKKIYTDMLVNQIKHGIITPLKANEILYGEGNYDNANPPPDEYFIGGIQAVNKPEPEPVEEVINPNLIEDLAKEAEEKTNGNGKTNKNVIV